MTHLIRSRILEDMITRGHVASCHLYDVITRGHVTSCHLYDMITKKDQRRRYWDMTKLITHASSMW